jgi:RNA polymerase sigma-70 factor (ECF subfamily)
MGGWLNFETFDAPYVERLRQGDEATERHFHTYFGELITLKARSRLQSRQAVEDVRQETFSRFFVLLRSEGGIRQAERLGPLVNSICNNVLFEQYRSNKRADPLEDETARQLVDRRSDALHELIATETSKKVRDILLGLSDRDRNVLQAVFLQDRDKDEVCRELGIDRNYMRVLVHRAKESFRQQYTRQTGRGKGIFPVIFMLLSFV